MGRVKAIKSRTSAPGSRLRPAINYGQGRGPGWEKIRAMVYWRDHGLCRNCFERGRLTPIDLHNPADPTKVGYCDHYIPKTQGGSDDQINLWMLCFDCNEAKNAEDSAHKVREARQFHDWATDGIDIGRFLEGKAQ